MIDDFLTRRYPVKMFIYNRCIFVAHTIYGSISMLHWYCTQGQTTAIYIGTTWCIHASGQGKDEHRQLKETIAHQRSLYWMSFRFACVNIAILAYTSSEDIRSRNLHQAKFDTNTPLIVFMQRFIEAVTILTPTRRTPERSIPIFCAPSFFHCQGVSFVSRNDIQL